MLKLLLMSRFGTVLATVFAIGAIAVGAVLLELVHKGSVGNGGKELVVVGFGGSFGDAFKSQIIPSFERETGYDVRYEETCCSRIVPTIDADEFAGDVACGIDIGGLLNWAKLGYLASNPELINLSESRGIPQQYRHSSILVPTKYAYIIAGHGLNAKIPGSWSEFWNRDLFPGRRVLFSSSPAAQLEASLLADGVPADRLYPLDVDRAFLSLNRLRHGGDILFANSPADAVHLIVSGNADYAIAYSNRIEAASAEGLEVTFDYRSALWTGNGCGLLKNIRNQQGALSLFEYMTRPEQLNRFVKAAGLVSVATGGDSKNSVADETSNEIDSSYWRDNRTALAERWVRWLVQTQ